MVKEEIIREIRKHFETNSKSQYDTTKLTGCAQSYSAWK